jgi:hypothetical protein
MTPSARSGAGACFFGVGRLFAGCAAAAILTIVAGCAPTRAVVTSEAAAAPRTSAGCPIVVMWPTAAIGAFRGSVGVDARDVESRVAEQILHLARERCPASEVLQPIVEGPTFALPGYLAALGGTTATAIELHAAAAAFEGGAKYLLVPSIDEWNQTRTDDPIGAFAGAKNGVAVSARLMRLQSPAVMGRMTFSNRSHVNVNKSAARLLDDRFDRSLRKLLDAIDDSPVSGRAPA